MKKLKDLFKKLNQTQKIIVGIVVGLVSLVITIAITDDIGYPGPFDWDDTWFVWVLFILVVGFFEYILFSPNDD